MRNTVLISLMRILKPQELDKCKVFLDSPYFNTNPTVTALFQELTKFYPNFDAAKLTKSHLQKVLSPNKPLQEGTIRNLMKDLSNCLRQFLAHEKLTHNKVINEQLLYESYSERKYKKAFDSLYIKQLTNTTNTQNVTRYGHLNRYVLLEKYYHYPDTNRKEVPADHLGNAVHHLDRFFVLSQLLIKIETKARLRFLKEDLPNFHFDKAMIDFINTLPENEKPRYELLLLILEIQESNKPDLVDGALELYKNNFHNFSGFYSKLLLKVLINQMNRLLQDGHSEYLIQMHKLYKLGLKQNILIYDQSLSVDDYLNIVIASSRSGEVTWAESFSQKHIQYLPSNDQPVALALAKITIQFDQGKYDQVNNELINNPFRNPAMGFRYKLLQIKSYTEMAIQNPKEIPWVLKRLRSIDRDIRRQGEKGETERARLFLNFLKVVKKILAYLQKEKNTDYHYWEMLIKNSTPIVAKKWLLQKIDELE